MVASGCLTVSSLAAIFEEEVGVHGGTVVDTLLDEEWFYGRAVLPRTEMIVPGDGARGGVAIRAIDGEVWVHPYLFRVVCANGFIAPAAFSTRYLSRADLCRQSGVLQFIRETISACCSDAKLDVSVGRLKETRDVEADLLLAFMSFPPRVGKELRVRMLKRLLDFSPTGAGRTLFDLLNHITSIARDTAEPQDRWDLEEFAGRILSEPIRRPPICGEAANVRGAVAVAARPR